jgi:hypothetical protein
MMDESRGLDGTHANFPAVCFVTAAAIPPLSLACFLSFLEEGIQLIWASVGAVSYPKNARVSAERSCQ